MFGVLEFDYVSTFTPDSNKKWIARAMTKDAFKEYLHHVNHLYSHNTKSGHTVDSEDESSDSDVEDQRKKEERKTRTMHE